ncbi:DUF7108 family protein [Natrialbaceae archaeon A-gly3]
MSDASIDSEDGEDGGDDPDLPTEVLEETERLTRLARTAAIEDEREAYRRRRAEILSPHEYTARVREEADGDVLVIHPEEWHDGEVIRTDRIEDLSRAIEIRLEGAADPDDWDTVDAENRAIVEEIREEHGDVHAENAAVLADFMGNHYARPMASATEAELQEFLEDYFVRNAWPSEAQRAAIEESIELVFETAGESVPRF